MIFSSLLLFQLALSGTLPPMVEEELNRAASAVPARAHIARHKLHLPNGCSVNRVEVPVLSGTSELAIRIFGKNALGASCDGWAWVKVQLFARAWVTRQALDAGARLADNVVAAERELLVGRPFLTILPTNAVSAHRLGPNVAIEPSHVRENGPLPGQKVSVRIALGSLAVEQEGRTVPCSRGLACALLPNGRRVEGRWDGERILLEAP